MTQHLKLQYVIQLDDFEQYEAIFELSVPGTYLTLQQIYDLCWRAVDQTPWTATNSWKLWIDNLPVAVPQWSLTVVDGKCPAGVLQKNGGEELTEFTLIKPFVPFTKGEVKKIEQPPYEENGELFWIAVLGDPRGTLTEHPAQDAIELPRYI